MKLVLGVVDIAYSSEAGNVTTGDVAEFLESSYGVMRIFAEEYEYRIGQWLADGLADQIQDMANGAPRAADPFADGEQQIERAFRQFIASGEIERINPDLPSQAAIEGRSKRRKRSSGPRRVSLVDTGNYVASFRCWMSSDDSGVT